MLAGIYIHIPFCATRCHYCNFATGGYESEMARRYTAAVREEIGRADVSSDPMMRRVMRRVDTIYFGGGTPTTLTVGQISSLIEACRREFDVAPDPKSRRRRIRDRFLRIISKNCVRRASTV